MKTSLGNIQMFNTFSTRDSIVSIFHLHRKQVAASRAEAEKDNVVVPTTIEEYCIKHRSKPTVEDVDILTDFYDDDYDDGDDDDCGDDYNDDNEDSGNGES